MIAINSASPTIDFTAEKLALLDATSDGLDVYAHFSGLFNCEGMPRLGVNYASPFPLEKKYRKSFRLSLGKNGQVVFNDFAAQLMGDCFTFVEKLLGYTFKETVNFIKQTILNGCAPTYSVETLLQRVGRPRLIEKPILNIEPWLRHPDARDDFAYTRYDLVGITPSVREQYHAYLLGGARIGNRFNDHGEPQKDYTIEHSASNPLYGYWYPAINRWKLNRPEHSNKDFRWGPNNVRNSDNCIFGQHLLPDPSQGKQPLGILAPGQRDTMASAAMLGCWVGCLGSESAHLSPEQFGLLSACFEHLAFFTDNDEAGSKGAAHLQTTWGLQSLNPIVQALGENDLCAWLKSTDGQRPDLRRQVATDLRSLATAR